jgi:hypothetical protein
MATTGIGATLPNYLDVMKRMRPDGGIETLMVELMTQENGLLKDMVWKEGNLPTGHRITRRSTVPTPEFRLLNAGVSRAKSRSDQVDESVGLMESLSVVDTRLANLNGNSQAFRASEDMAFRQGFSNLFETTMWYGNTETDPEKWMGLSPRFDLTTAAFGGQMVASGISASGSDQNSLWFLDWGLDTVHGIYAKGAASAGFMAKPLSDDLVLDEDGKEFLAHRTQFSWECGLAVPDPRHVVRVYNIDSSAVSAESSLLVQGIIKGYHQLMRGGRSVAYCNPFVAGYLHLQARYGALNGTLTVSNTTGEPLTSIFGIPLRISQGLVKTEDALS